MRLARFVLLFVFTVGLGAGALGSSLALLGPAATELKTATAYSPIDPTMTAPAERSYMYDRHGNLMTTLFAEEDRSPIELEAVPQHLVDAVLAIEDRRFYEHGGIDFSGVGRALRENIDAGGVEQGGSTITQQLVKNTLLDPEERRSSGRDIWTKIKEAVLANRLEDVVEKDEILERYLNVIYLGNGAYGVQAAAERYWNKQPRELTIGESALLAGLIQAPEDFNPVVHPDRAARRRSLVLDAMVELEMITPAQADAANLEPIPTQAVSPLRNRDFFTTEVIEVLLRDDPDVEGDVGEFLGDTRSERYNQIFRGGLRVHTTYDPIVQFVAATSVERILPDTPVVASVVVVDNADLAVRAMYPGFDFSELEYNPITADGRQTGSTFKAITLATALEAGYSPRDRVSGNSVRIERAGDDYSTSCGSGTLSLREAIYRSNNCAFIRTIVSLGPGRFGDEGAERVREVAGRLGIDTSKLVAFPTLTLGTSNTNMLDMAEAFAVFANEGLHQTPMFVTRVEGPDGEVIYEADRDPQRVLGAQVARTETDMLRDVISRGTGRRADIGRPAAGKTGTTDRNTDAWFVGYTPQYTTAVWMGYPFSARPMAEFGVTGAQGGSFPARIWAAIMGPLHEELPVVDFTPPDEQQWPTGQRISAEGRTLTRASVGGGSASTTTTAPADTTTTGPTIAATTTVPAPTTSPPPATSPSTAAPAAATTTVP